MIKLTNYISKILFKDPEESHSILTYIDIDGIIVKEFIINYLNEIIKKNSLLKNRIIEKNDILFLDNIKKININDYYSIEYVNEKYFDNFIYNMLNEKFTTELKWKFLFCIDNDSQKSRIYFKINHANADGYQIIKILTSLNQNYDITKQLKRKTTFLNTLYHYFIGTIILIFMNIKILINMLFNFFKNNYFDENCNNNKVVKDTDYIICKNLNLNKIKLFTKTHNISINDFLYSLMIKADKIYTKKKRNIVSLSPINTSNLTQTNNICPVLININNSYDNYGLLKKVNTIFNYFKFSLFIPTLFILINLITPYIHLDILSKGHKNLLDNVDYVYSNIIGPQNVFLNKDFNISNIHFLTNAQNKEINYNIISSGNNINIICSFKKGIIKNKKKFRKCINNAYNTLINTF